MADRESELVLQIADHVRKTAEDLRDDLGERIDAVGKVVLQQNSRIAKGETRDDEIERRLNVIEAGHRFVNSHLPRPETPPESDFSGKDPVTGRDLKVLAWGLSSAVTVGGFLWGVLKWIGQVRP